MSPRPDLGPKPLLGYTANHLARVAERRGDAAFLAAREQDPKAAAVAVGGELIVLKRSANGFDALFSPREVRALAPTAESVFLGVADNAGRFGIALDPEATKALKGRDDLLVIDLRSIAVQGLVGPSSSRRSPKRKRCSPGMRGIVSAPIAARRRTSRRPAGSANVQAARSSTSRAPIRS
jgi:hypothetical protein